ncbi:putative glycine-rich cell wall structural protein 1 isoform X2 [Medicago truncatula]|uniref:putative glycine-rich cell wall structural protein 1 isoform X2 n=1 Tax=Medicago truncatula TaxID=3880 RepID=UPI000D2F3A33|nr:putative glycine-rich cell wall structural protein 1 isoform X2 [Medicago truncatula]
MKTKLFVSVCFYALLLIFLVAIMPSEGAIWNGKKGKNIDGFVDGIEGHCGKGYVDNTWKKGPGWGTSWWWGRGGKGGKGGKGSGGGYKIPLPVEGKGGGEKGGGDGKL